MHSESALARFSLRSFTRVAAVCLATALACTTAAADGPIPVHVRLPDPLSPAARTVKYSDPLDEALRREKLGRVTGGGTQLTRDRRIVSVELDLELVDVEQGVPFVRHALRRLGAPPGSMVEFERFGLAVELPVHD